MANRRLDALLVPRYCHLAVEGDDMPTRLARRVLRIAPSPTIAVMAEAKRLAREGIDVVDLGPGEPDFPTPAPIAEAGIRAIREGRTTYTPVAGIPELREAICEHYNQAWGTRFSPSNVVVGAGGKQALFNACLTLFEAGDEVLIPTPCWVSFPEMVRLADAEAVLVPTAPENGLRATRRELEAAWTERTRGVILCSPANPHGAIIEREELEGILEMARERNATVIFDECYELFVYDRPHVSAASCIESGADHVVLSGTFSKTFSMTGWRVGYMVASEEIARAASDLQGHSTTNASTMGQWAALASFSPERAAMIEPMLAEYRRRRELVVQGLRAIPGFVCDEPDGAFYVFPEVGDVIRRGGFADDTALARALIEEARVAVVPGSAFCRPGYLRLSFATSESRLREGLARLREFVAGLGS